MQQKHSNLAASLVWFTAAISMAEILTGDLVCSPWLETRDYRYSAWTYYWRCNVLLCWINRR